MSTFFCPILIVLIGNFRQDIQDIYTGYAAPRQLFGDLQMRDLGWPLIVVSR